MDRSRSNRQENPQVNREPDAPRNPATAFKPNISALLVAAVFIASVALYWHGFGPMGDAERYVAAALEWRENSPYLGETHWALRHLFVLPMTAAFTAFGSSEFAATLPNILYAAGLVAVTFLFGRKYLGEPEGATAAILIAISAFFVSRTTEVGVYGAEVFFAALSSWLFVAAQFERRRVALLIAAGAVAGLAWTIREQTLSLVVAFGLLTLIGRRQVLLSLFAIGAGFGSVLLLELLVYWLAAGDPFYRYNIDLHHRSAGWATLDSSRDTIFAKLFRPLKDLATDPVTTPFFLMALAGSAMLWRGLIKLKPLSAQVFFNFAIISAVAALISAYAFDLALPRYYPIFPYFIFVFLGATIVAIGKKYGVVASALCLVLTAALNAAGDDFGNYNEYAEARALARYATISSEPIFTDPLTASRTRYLLRLSDTPRDEISMKIRSDREYPTGVLLYSASPELPQTGFWCPIGRMDVRPHNWTHSFIRAIGINKVFGGSIDRITQRPRPVELIRVLPAPAQFDPASGKPCLISPAQ